MWKPHVQDPPYRVDAGKLLELSKTPLILRMLFRALSISSLSVFWLVAGEDEERRDR